MRTLQRRIERLEERTSPPGRWFSVIMDRTADGRQFATHDKTIIEQRRGESDAAFETRYRSAIGMGPDDSIIVHRIIDPDQPGTASGQHISEPPLA
jgi:hypothetical protein